MRCGLVVRQTRLGVHQMAAEVSDLARGDLLEHHHPVALLEGQAEAGK